MLPKALTAPSAASGDGSCDVFGRRGGASDPFGRDEEPLSSATQRPDVAMIDRQGLAQEPPRWLVWFFWSSLASAAMAGTLLLWAKWGLALSMAQDLWKYCF